MQFCHVGLLAGQQKCHTNICSELQDIAAGHTTFVGAADMSARPVLMLICIPICPVFG